MSRSRELSRRAFLARTGMTAIAGAVGTSLPASSAGKSALSEATFDFDTPYSRIGTDSTKWDQQIRTYGKDNVAVGMGIADMDFRAAPCITDALRQRLLHENWGYLDMPKSFSEGIVSWNKRRHGIDINPQSLVITTGV